MKRNKNSCPVEMRSTKVQKLLGDIPVSLERWGIAILICIVAALLLAVTLVPYPHSNGESIISHIF